MNRWAPCKRRDFIKRLRRLGFTGPFSGSSRHQFMVYEQHRLAIPSNSEYSIHQFKMMLQEIENIIGHEISLEEWYNL